jgi:hypothetical protein
MEARYGLAQRIWVMDRGMTSEDNLEWLRERQCRYLVGTPKSELRKWARQIADAQDWHTVRNGVEAKQCVGPDGRETFVLIRSIERREKEHAMHARFCRRIEEGLTKLAQRLTRARRPLDRSRLERQVGRLLERNPRAAGRYVIEFVADSTRPAKLRLTWMARPEWDDWARWSEGCYVLRSNIADWSPEDLWRTYIQLTEAEAPFASRKASWGSGPCGISAPTACRPMSSCASWRTSSGRPCNSGNAARGSATARGPSWKNSVASRVRTLFSQPRTAVNSACGASSVPTQPKRPFWTALG